MKRLLYFDVIRVLACIMIVLMHSPMSGLGTPGPVLSGISYVTAPGIGLFFMISGALILKTDKPLDNVFTFLKHRMLKIIIPLAFWTVVYNALYYLGLDGSGRGVMWFLWTLGGLYLLSPILIRWLQKASQKELQFYLGLWGISLCYPWLKLITSLDIGDTSWLYYFHGYVGYFILGYYLSKYQINKWILIPVTLILSVLLPLLSLFYKWNVDFYQVFWYLSPSIAVFCVAIFVFAKLLFFNQTSEKISWLATHCFGVYLVHILIMRGILWHTEWMQNMNGVLQIVLCFGITFASALLFTIVLRKIPFLCKVVG